MKALQTFVDQKNHWNSFFKGAQYEIATAAGRQQVADMIDGALSPENLTCDGELSRAEIAMRYQLLIQASRELTQLDPEAAKAIYELYTGE